MSILYQITNLQNGKSYIGWSNNTLEGRWDSHVRSAMTGKDNRKFYNAIRKYGVDCWDKQVLMEVENTTIAKQKEIELIEKLDTYNTGYNSTKGGDGNNGIIMSEESNHKRSLALKGKPKTYDRMKGKTHSEETKRKISEAHKGMHKPWINFTEEHRKKSAASRRQITKEQYLRLLALRSEGKKLSEISLLIGLSKDMVKKWTKMEWPE